MESAYPKVFAQRIDQDSAKAFHSRHLRFAVVEERLTYGRTLNCVPALIALVVYEQQIASLLQYRASTNPERFE